jgi:hypothetical protein
VQAAKEILFRGKALHSSRRIGVKRRGEARICGAFGAPGKRGKRRVRSVCCRETQTTPLDPPRAPTHLLSHLANCAHRASPVHPRNWSLTDDLKPEGRASTCAAPPQAPPWMIRLAPRRDARRRLARFQCRAAGVKAPGTRSPCPGAPRLRAKARPVSSKTKPLVAVMGRWLCGLRSVRFRKLAAAIARPWRGSR